MTHGDDDHFEPVPGLPEPLPAGERVLWRGSPVWTRLAVDALHVRKLSVYFAALLLLQAAVTLANGATLGQAVAAMALPLPLAILAVALLAGFARLAARATVYTITDRRIVMRIGIVLTVTFNLPFKRIGGASLKTHADGTGDIAVQLLDGNDRIAWAHLWPHVRPWRLRRPEPSLRSIPDAKQVAQLLADALRTVAVADGANVPVAVTSAAPAAGGVARPDRPAESGHRPALA